MGGDRAGRSGTRVSTVLAVCVQAGLALLLLTAAAAAVSDFVNDPDFFWHLRTGDWIREHRSLPKEFLFSLTAPPAMNDTLRVTMTSYWAVQVLYSALHAIAGFAGIAALRGALLALLVATLFWRRSGKDGVVLLATALMAVLVLRLYPFERPQVFAFLFFSLLLLALDRLRAVPAGAPAPRPLLAAVPLLMLCWANSHGSFVIGQGVILLYLVAEGVKLLHPALQPLSKDRYRTLAGAGAAGILAAFANPNGWHVLAMANLPAWLKAGNLEYQSTVAFFRATGALRLADYWALLALAIAALALSWRKPDITRIALLAGTGAVSFAENRHMAFFVLSAVPVIEGTFSRDALVKAGRVVVAVPALASGLFFLGGDLAALRHPGNAARVNPLVYPEDSAAYVEANRPEGNFYSYWPWGGYLLWRLAPAKVFIDGRNSRLAVLQLNAAVESGNRYLVAGQPPWKGIFRAFGIRYAILPVFDPQQGEVPELVFALAGSPGWSPAFVGVNSVVLVEDGADRGEAGRQRLPSGARLLDLLARRCAELADQRPGDPFPRIGRGDLLGRLGRYEEAREAYGSALRIAPANAYARERLAALGGAGRGGG